MDKAAIVAVPTVNKVSTFCLRIKNALTTFFNSPYHYWLNSLRWVLDKYTRESLGNRNTSESLAPTGFLDRFTPDGSGISTLALRIEQRFTELFHPFLSPLPISPKKTSKKSYIHLYFYIQMISNCVWESQSLLNSFPSSNDKWW